jgi:hypothetical protein
MTTVSPSTWLARLWQEAAQIFDKWSVDGAKGEHDGPIEEHPDVQAVAAHLAETKPDAITADQPMIADHIAKVVSGMQNHASMLMGKPDGEDDGNPEDTSEVEKPSAADPAKNQAKKPSTKADPKS